MAFPSSPTDGQIHIEDGLRYVWRANSIAPGVGSWELAPALADGLPPGGAADDHLAKRTAADFDVQWVTPGPVSTDDGTY